MKHQCIVSEENVWLDLLLHPSAEPEDQVESTLLLDVVVREGPPIFQLLASENQPLLVRGDTFLVLQRKRKNDKTE